MEYKFRAYYQRFSDGVWIIEGEYTLKDLTDRGIQFDQDRMKWVMWTGLKDKTGVEIYEGDFVEYEIQTGPERAYVFWLDELACFGSMPINNNINKGDLFFEIGNESVEVIGNKYENPELLIGKAITNNIKKQ